MKKRIIIAILVIMTLLFTGCGKTDFDFTRIGDNTTIKAHTTDGKSADTEYFTVGKNEHAVVETSLDKGTLNMEFISVTVFIHTDEPDDIMENGIATTIKVTGNDKTTLNLERGDYIIRVTAEGDTEGTVKITVEK